MSLTGHNLRRRREAEAKAKAEAKAQPAEKADDDEADAKAEAETKAKADSKASKKTGKKTGKKASNGRQEKVGPQGQQENQQMKTLCIWAESRDKVLALYDALAESENPPQRITWRLAGSFVGKPVGDECFAPDHPEIREAYGEKPKPKKSKKSK